MTISDQAFAELPPGTFPGWDSAFIPQVLPAGYAGVYVGGSNAFRIAPDAELRRVAAGLVLPIWVPSPWIDNPRQVAFQVAARLEQLGIPRYARPYRAVMIDLETWADPTWLEAFAARFISQGYDTIPYGSPSSIFSQPHRLGYAVASPTGNPHMYQHPNVIITQYAWDLRAADGTLYDGDLALSWVARHLGPIRIPAPPLDAEDQAEPPEAARAARVDVSWARDAEPQPAAPAAPDVIGAALGPGRFVPPSLPVRDIPQA